MASRFSSSAFCTVILFATVFSTHVIAADPVGWRGDGTGLYPKADPPAKWSQVSKSVAALRFQAEPPKSDGPAGQEMPDGIIRQWLVLGPIETQKGEKRAILDAAFAEDQTKLSPAAGGEHAGSKWQAFTAENAYIDCAKLFGVYEKKIEKAAYAHAYVYSPEQADFVVRIMHLGSASLWVNGKLAHKNDLRELVYTPLSVTLQKGWNRVLVRILPADDAPQLKTVPWYTSIAFQAAPSKAQYEQKNIAWRTLLPGDGFGSPIVVGGKIFLLSEPTDLVCLDAATGKILWIRSNGYNEVATDEERKANADTFKEIDETAAKLKQANDSFVAGAAPKREPVGGGEQFKEKSAMDGKLNGLMKKIDQERYSLPKGQDVGFSGMAPVSDGKLVYAWFATGVTCCYDLDGKLIWRRLDNEGSFFEHGYSTSPVLADGKLIVFMNKMIGLDAATGKRLWTTQFDPKISGANRFHGTPAVTKIDKTAVCILPTGYIIRAEDGALLHQKGSGISARQQQIPSPVVIGDKIYRLGTYNDLCEVQLPAQVTDPLEIGKARTMAMDLDRYPNFYLPWHMSSPLIHDGLAYLVNNAGVLTVVDIESMKVVYEKLLDIDHFQTHHETAGRGVGSSPAFAGGKIYIVGNTGTTLVIKPGRTYEQIAKNKIENVFFRYYGLRHERFVGCPAFDGKKMYIRGERNLYCIAE